MVGLLLVANMARIPYLNDDSIPENLTSLVDKIRLRRPKKQLLNLDRVLLYSEPVASGWQIMFAKLRNELDFNGKLRELIILRIAVLNKAEYEFKQHYPEAIKEGMTFAQIEAIKSDDLSSYSDMFNEIEWTIIAYTDAMTKLIQVPEEVFIRLGKFFSAKQIVEITALVAGYNMVSRFLEALQINIEHE